MPDLDVVVVYPELLGLYADRGNALAVRHRAEARGLSVRVIELPAGSPVPATADLYLLGGAEDAAMLEAVALLRAQPALARAVAQGASVLGVCAGFQLLGHTFATEDGRRAAGLGLLDVSTDRLPTARAVGEVLLSSSLAGEIQGFENHRGRTRLGPTATRLGTVRHGVGNGSGRAEGAVQGNLVGTYLHGPVLVRNPELTDLLLRRMTGTTLPELADPVVEQLRAERRREIRRAGRWYRRLGAR